MTRFIVLPSDAAELVLKVGQLAMPGEILVLKMKAVRIRDLAEASLDFYSRMYGRDPKARRLQSLRAGRERRSMKNS